MALGPNELFESSPGKGSQKRIAPTRNRPKEFAVGSGTVLAGSLVAYETVLAGWVPWVDGGANGAGVMAGILWPDDLTLDAGDETLAQVMLAGAVHRDDIELNGELQADVDAELQVVARTIDIHVEGLIDVR